MTSATGERTVHLRTCPLCEAMCGLEIHVEGDQVALIRADKDDTWSKGHLCPKGTTLGHLHHDPDRLRQPLVRDGDGWREVSWDEAFRRCSELLAPVVAEHGIEAVTAYVGNPLAHNFSLGRYVGILIGMSGIPMIYSAGTVDQWPKNVSSHLMYGGMWKIPVPDIQRTDYLVVMGANPHASQGSLLACPDVMGEIDAIRERGGKVIVVDPRRTGTAAAADEWLAITPGTDAAFLLAVANVVVTEGLVRLGAVADLLDGVEELEALVADWTPERVAPVTGIDADRIRSLARELATTERAVVYGRIGLCNQEFGTLASWLVDVVNIITGHFDAVGGLMFPRPAVWSVTDLPMPGLENGVENFGRWKTRVRGASEVLGHVPVSCLAEEIATPGKGQIRALFTVAGNPVLSTPGGDRLDAALDGLDCMISVDNWLNETTRHADVILPGLSPLEQPHHDDLIWNFAVGSAANYSPAIFPPTDGRPEEWEILIRLAGACLGENAADMDVAAIDDGFFDVLADTRGFDGPTIRAQYDHGGPIRMLDLTLRTGPFGDRYGENPDGVNLEKLEAEPHGIYFGPMEPCLADVLTTESGKVRLAPSYITDDLPRLAARLDRPLDELVLVSRRHLRSNNSWMHNVNVLVKGKDRCTLLVHPKDAALHGIDDGALARVTSAAGSVDVAAEVTEDIRPGVVSLPHGWGHNLPGTRLGVANDHAGVNTNVLAPGTFVDVISGNAAVNGIPVTISAVPPGSRGSCHPRRGGRRLSGMRLDNLVLVLVASLALGLAGTIAWRGRRLPIVGPVESASVGRSALDALRSVACVLTAALGAGVLVVGLGGRLVMRILAATSGDSAQGLLTEAREKVGEITFGGTMAFIVFVGIGLSLFASFGYLAVRRVLPTESWTAGLVFGAILLGTLGVADPLSPDNVDFAILTPRWLAIALIALTALLFGTTFTALAARLDRAVPLLSQLGSPRSRWSTLAYGSLLVVLLPIFLVPTAVYVGARSVGRGRLGSRLARRPVHLAGVVLVTILLVGAVASAVNAAAEIL